MSMIRHLLDFVKLDVNAVRYQPGKMCTTALCFVAFRGWGGQNFRELVFCLLDHGADPESNGGMIDDHHWPTPLECAKSQSNWKFLQAVEEWKTRQAQN